MKKVLILGGATTQVYASATGALTVANAATDPSLLASGSIGIYGLVDEDDTTAANVGLTCLITESTDGTLQIQDSDFASLGNDLVTIAQGGASSAGFPVTIPGIQRKNVYKIVKQVYSAPVKQVSYIGWNGTTGAMTLPTIAANDDATLIAIQKEATTSDQIREQENYSVGGLAASETEYNILAGIVNSVNNQPTLSKTHTAGITTNGTQADFTGTGTALKFTKGSTTVLFMIQDGTDGWVASTGTVAAADIIGVAHANMKSVSFAAAAAGSSAGRHVITIAGTIYNVADAGTDALNATAIAAAINAGTQATAAVTSSTTVTITLVPSLYSAKILAQYTTDDSSFSTPALTVITTTGETQGTIYKAAAAVSAAASFELDRAYVGETGYWLGLTSVVLGAGIITTNTLYGIKMVVDAVDGSAYSYAKQGVIQYATITYSVNPTKGFGTGTAVSKIEEGLIAYRGQMDTMSKWAKQLPRYANVDSTYTAYTLMFTQYTTATGAPHNKSANSTVIIFVPSGQTTLIASITAIFIQLFTNALFINN